MARLGSMTDAPGLDRFIAAQAPLWLQVTAELRAGRKQTHWMWFVFPQLAGLGQSATARHYGIADLAEAQAYLAHTLLGPRLLEATRLVNAHAGRTALAIFGTPDDLKFRSCATLFARAGGGRDFTQALASFYGGQEDAATLRLLTA